MLTIYHATSLLVDADIPAAPHVAQASFGAQQEKDGSLRKVSPIEFAVALEQFVDKQQAELAKVSGVASKLAAPWRDQTTEAVV